MTGLLDKLKNQNVLVADGAMGTMLFKMGLKTGECPEKLNIEKPETLREIAQLYFEAGADIVHTNTFGASPLKLEQYSLQDNAELINAEAVRIVRQATKNKAYISASCGPSGRLLEPYGDTSIIEIEKSFERQLKVVVDEGVDMITIETMTDLDEAIIAIKTAKNISPRMPVCATMTFDPTPRGFFTIMGVSIEQAANGLADAGADIIGSNCGNGIENMLKIAIEFRKHTDLPLMIQSNAGIPTLKNDAPVYSESPEFMAEKCKTLFEYGVNIIGGCCGTTPEHIAAIRKIVDEFKSRFCS